MQPILRNYIDRFRANFPLFGSRSGSSSWPWKPYRLICLKRGRADGLAAGIRMRPEVLLQRKLSTAGGFQVAIPYRFNFLLTVFLLLSVLLAAQNRDSVATSGSGAGSTWVLVIHGGAGNQDKALMTEEKQQIYLTRLREALSRGGEILKNGGAALDAVEAAVRFMEDSPEFNAGRGAVLDEEGFAELDASIMDGRSGKAGAVGGVRTIKNPILAARKVMEKTGHVLLAGIGAEEFAAAQGLEIVEPSYFITDSRKADWERWKLKNNELKKNQSGEKDTRGTVGAVALDIRGNLAAATSTGGMMGKMKGRLGDTPIVGAGTWAGNNTCAVSATGHGEFFIRNVVAYDVAARMDYLNMELEDAANQVVMEILRAQGATGGLIAVDKNGTIAMPFNTTAMFRGYLKSDGTTEVAIF